ncbi:MAG: hypothetical protein ACSHX0_06515 [Akkermansiaceae bacterium]
MKIKYMTLLVLCIFNGLASAERVARVLYYGASKSAPQKAYVYQANEEVQEVELERYNFSKSFKLASGSTRLAFLPSALTSTEEGVSIPKNAPFLSIPESWKKVLILVFEDSSNTVMPIQFKAINASDNTFGPGELLFVNLSQLTIFGMVGDKKLVCKPNSKEIVSKPIQGRGSYPSKLYTIEGTDVESKRGLFHRSCEYFPLRRVMVIATSSPAARGVVLYSTEIRDL